MIRIAGLDPGSLKLGYGVIEASAGRLRHVAYGTLSAPRSQPLHRRLAILYDQLNEMLDEHLPDEVAIEKVFTAKNVSSALTLGQSRGMILLAVGRREVKLAEYAPAEIKKAVTGNGRAEKHQLAAMVGRILQINIASGEFDSTDALSIAICHAAVLQTARSLAGRMGS